MQSNRKGKRKYKPTTHQERTQGIAPFLFAYSPKGKKKLQNKAGKERQDKRTSKRQPEQSRQGEGQKAGKEMKRKANKRKNRGKHATSF